MAEKEGNGALTKVSSRLKEEGIDEDGFGAFALLKESKKRK